ncbi:MAG: polymerase, sigma-24 subunit, subfamily [Verrucomicrobia bacterium]|nr:polymerase, sigma-24 subunit, subfamily [Verrucomicrobiota bacterium]
MNSSAVTSLLELTAPPCAGAVAEQPTKLAALSEAELSRWFAAEVQPHARSLRAYLRARFPTLDSDDLVQEGFARVVKTRQAGPVDNPKSLLFTIARNAAFSLFRRDTVLQMESMGDMESLRVLMNDADAADAACQTNEKELLAQALQDLPARCREVVTLRMMHGLRHKEIAARLDITEGTVANQLTLGLERCRHFLAKHGIRSVPPS